MKKIEKTLAGFDALPDTAFVRVATVARLFDCSTNTIWRWVKADKFPHPRRLSERVTGYQVGEIRAALKSQNIEG